MSEIAWSASGSYTDIRYETTEDGKRMPVPPGRLWVELFPSGRSITID